MGERYKSLEEKNSIERLRVSALAEEVGGTFRLTI